MNATEHDFDIWLHGFAAETREAPQHALSRVFGIPEPAAEALLATLPRVVRRDASAAQAERIVQALEAIGGRAEAVPTKVVAAPVLVVGEPARPRPETIVRYAPRAGQRVQPGLDSMTGSSETLRLGTQELAAFFGATVERIERAARDDVNDTLVDTTPRWADLELAPAVAPPAAAAATPQVAAAYAVTALSLAGPLTASTGAEAAASAELEITRNALDWIQSVDHAPALSLEPLAAVPISGSPPSSNPAAWNNPLALPMFGEPLGPDVAMRPASERARGARMRSLQPPSMRPREAADAGPSLSAALAQLARGEVRAASRSYPSLAFALVLIGTAFAFVVAYAAL